MNTSRLTFSFLAIIAFAAVIAVRDAPAEDEGVKVKTRIGELTFSHDFVNGVPSKASREKLFNELDFQRACQAYIWALPPVASMQFEKDAARLHGATSVDVVSYKTYRFALSFDDVDPL